MREIKFRAYLKDEKKIVDVISLNILVGFITYYDDLAKEDLMVESPNYVLIQYTGLKDKTGKEIYEGDVFNFHPSKEWKDTEPDNPCVVFWSDDLAAWMFYVGKPEMSTLLPPPESIEIIGNVHENPELLEEGNK